MRFFANSFLSWILLVVIILVSNAHKLNCCLPKYSGKPSGCNFPTEYDGVVHYCVEVTESCSSCLLNATLTTVEHIFTSTSCSTCCAPSPTSCVVPYSMPLMDILGKCGPEKYDQFFHDYLNILNRNGPVCICWCMSLLCVSFMHCRTESKERRDVFSRSLFSANPCGQN